MRWIYAPLAALALAGLAASGGCGRDETPAPAEPSAPTEPAAPAEGRAPTEVPQEDAPTPAPVPAAERALREAGQIFATRCATCHGPEGAGDGPAGVVLEPRPRNFHDPAWQASVGDEHIERIIVEGGPAVGKSPLMPPNPDLVGKPEVVAALRERIRSFRPD